MVDPVDNRRERCDWCMVAESMRGKLVLGRIGHHRRAFRDGDGDPRPAALRKMIARMTIDQQGAIDRLRVAWRSSMPPRCCADYVEATEDAFARAYDLVMSAPVTVIATSPFTPSKRVLDFALSRAPKIIARWLRIDRARVRACVRFT